jgi:hypothetical protein
MAEETRKVVGLRAPLIAASVTFVLVGLVGWLGMSWSARPQVEVSNRGAVPLDYAVRGEERSLAPGTTGVFRCADGDSFVVRVPGAADAAPWEFTLAKEPVRGRVLFVDTTVDGRRVSFAVDVKDPR